MQKRALITGISGMDGSYLAEFLINKGYKVFGVVRRSSTFEGWWRLEEVRDKLTLYYGDITDPFSVMWAIKNSKPDEIYNLAAQSHVQVSWETPLYTAQTTGLGILNILEGIRILGVRPKVYQASTSELYSGKDLGMQNEETEFDPQSPYGTAKLYAFQIAKNYRDAFGMFVCNGILFNHESERRGDNFVTQKIVMSASSGEVRLGNTSAQRDWGYAPEYVEAMWLMMQQKQPDDYVVATGETNSVKEFVSWVEKACGHKIKIVHDKAYDRPQDVQRLCGDAMKLYDKTGWFPKIKGEKLAQIMYEKSNKSKN